MHGYLRVLSDTSSFDQNSCIITQHCVAYIQQYTSITAAAGISGIPGIWLSGAVRLAHRGGQHD
jgi:hypothetical protein